MSHVEEKEKKMGGGIEPESPVLLVIVGYAKIKFVAVVVVGLI